MSMHLWPRHHPPWHVRWLSGAGVGMTEDDILSTGQESGIAKMVVPVPSSVHGGRDDRSD